MGEPRAVMTIRRMCHIATARALVHASTTGVFFLYKNRKEKSDSARRRSGIHSRFTRAPLSSVGVHKPGALLAEPTNPTNPNNPGEHLMRNSNPSCRLLVRRLIYLAAALTLGAHAASRGPA